MEQNRYEEGRFSAGAKGLGTVSEEMVCRRAAEIAATKGRSREQVLDSDLDEAYRELTGRERLNTAPSRAEELAENRRWQEVAIGEAQQAPTVPAPDEQTFPEKLVEKGVADAEHDQAVKAAREGLRRDNP